MKNLKPNSTYNCKICHDTGYAVKSMIVPDYDPTTHVLVGSPCPICKGRVDFGESGFPKMFSEADMGRFDFAAYKGQQTAYLEQITGSFWKSFSKWEKSGKSLYLWSETKGSGKTFLSCCLAGSIKTKYRKTIRFVSVLDYFQALKDAFKNGCEMPNSLYGYMNCDLLVLDDLGSEKVSEWTNQELFRLVDHRMNMGKLILVTSNMPINQLKCDNRVADRLGRMCIPMQMPEISIRAEKAKEENEKFIRKMLQEENN